MDRHERFNALPYSKRVGKALRVFVPLVAAYGISAALELDSLTAIFGGAMWLVGFVTILVLCGGKSGRQSSPDWEAAGQTYLSSFSRDAMRRDED